MRLSTVARDSESPSRPWTVAVTPAHMRRRPGGMRPAIRVAGPEPAAVLVTQAGPDSGARKSQCPRARIAVPESGPALRLAGWAGGGGRLVASATSLEMRHLQAWRCATYKLGDAPPTSLEMRHLQAWRCATSMAAGGGRLATARDGRFAIDYDASYDASIMMPAAFASCLRAGQARTEFISGLTAKCLFLACLGRAGGSICLWSRRHEGERAGGACLGALSRTSSRRLVRLFLRRLVRLFLVQEEPTRAWSRTSSRRMRGVHPAPGPHQSAPQMEAPDGSGPDIEAPLRTHGEALHTLRCRALSRQRRGGGGGGGGGPEGVVVVVPQRRGLPQHSTSGTAQAVPAQHLACPSTALQP
jgi:hypothetical protein